MYLNIVIFCDLILILFMPIQMFDDVMNINELLHAY